MSAQQALYPPSVSCSGGSQSVTDRQVFAVKKKKKSTNHYTLNQLKQF